MLKQYGPDIPDAILQKLVAAFGELRAMADQGTITYPYSTGEVVNIVKHLLKFPDEGLANVVRNVFDFDSYNKDTQRCTSMAFPSEPDPPACTWPRSKSSAPIAPLLSANAASLTNILQFL
ncbi:von Willebrand factor A domain-containing protein 8-like [Sinocyclocheilus grahami]|uniref:von Willebrand factor A domain-containing protein 8-like n=1 Tax=Sinocyclocheilus grahami TaxID=75366 RepID=UPI0007AC8696|nr:PREDICTED: von Willebrand factor A domain-containing protein 8-like [Sinocyclocheilus grahami]